MKSGLLAGALVTSMVVLPVVMSAGPADAPMRKAAPAFTLNDSKGAPVSLAKYRGKVVLVDFWATWCTGCKLEIPWFIEFQKKYESGGLAAVGVAMDDEGWPMVKPYLAAHPIPYPIVVGNLDLMQKKFGLDPNLPATFLIDRSGNIAYTHKGVVEKDAFEKEIRQLLQEKAKR